MGNLEYLEKVKKGQREDFKIHNVKIEDLAYDANENELRQTLALEIIAEELIGINYHLKNFAEAIQSFTNENQTAIRVENIGR